METVRTSGEAVNHMAVGFAHTWAWLAFVLGLEGQPFIWIVMPKSGMFLKSQAGACQYNFHNILKCHVTCVIACSVVFHTRSPVCFPLFSIAFLVLPSLTCSLATTEHAEVWINEISFLRMCSLLYSQFSGVFTRVFYLSLRQFGEKNRKWNFCSISAISIYLLFLYLCDSTSF